MDQKCKNSLAQAAHRLREGFHLNEIRQEFNYISEFKSSPV